MNHHFHLVAVPEAADSLARTIGRLEADSARYLNVRRRTSGHLWQCCYYSIPMQEEYVWAALAYVERNPARARADGRRLRMNSGTNCESPFRSGRNFYRLHAHRFERWPYPVLCASRTALIPDAVGEELGDSLYEEFPAPGR